MARYKVDKKKFDEKMLEEQLRSVELQKKYLKDEPLKRSEVDEYNKLQANGWIKNTLISLGVTFATAIAFIVFILLGNMLFTNGRTGGVGKVGINSSELYDTLKKDEKYAVLIPNAFEDPINFFGDDQVGYGTRKLYVPVNFLTDPAHEGKVYVIYEYVYTTHSGWNVVTYENNNGGTTTGALGNSKEIGQYNGLYTLDTQEINLNDLMTQWFLGQEDGWAKTLIKDFFYTAWPLTLVLWMVFFIVVISYLVVMVVGIRYVIRTVIGVLRRAGYIASDFVSEVVDSVRSELPIVDEEQAEELDLVAVRKQVQKKLAQDDSMGGLPEYKFEPEDNLEVDVPKKKESLTAPLKEVKEKEEEEDEPVAIASPEPVVEEPKEEKKKESKAQDKITDIFNL